MEKRDNKELSRIVLIGAESTGKTDLAEYLSKEFNTICVPEYARQYVENLHRSYTYTDVEYIANQQVILEQDAVQKANKVLFYDTFLIITKVWFKLVYNKIPSWIHKSIENSKIDLFLLCNNEIPWIADSVRENGGEMREKLFKIYEDELKHYNFNYKIIKGLGDKRRENALSIVNDFLN